jgi:ribulose-5-phosphate 4-epimerase/fuculose-1-phosphate aldolase
MHDIYKKLTDAWHIVGSLNYVDAIFNHISVAWLGPRDRLLVAMNPEGTFASEVEPADWITFPLDEVDRLTPETLGVNADGYRLHSQIHRNRARPGTALHSHSEHALAVGAMVDGLLPISQIAIEFIPETISLDYEGLFRGTALEPSLKELVQRGGVVLLRNHGLLIVTDSLEEAVYLQHYMEVACKIQILALSQGRALTVPSNKIIVETAAELRKDRSIAAVKLFDAYRRALPKTG